MKGLFKCIFLVLVLVLSSVPISCLGQAGVSVGKNYMQFLRAQKFMQMNGKPKNRKINSYFSEDMDEFDEYEADDDSDTNESSNSGDTNKVTKSELPSIDNEKTIEKDLKGIDKEGMSLVGGETCTVNEKGLLDVSINSEDFFNLKKYTVQLTSSSLVITDTENNNEIIDEISYEHIKLPIETIEETRECWKIKTNKETLLFCETTKQNRDKWIVNILKALFCYNVNVLTVQKNMDSIDLNERILIPKESTVDQRMKNIII